MLLLSMAVPAMVAAQGGPDAAARKEWVKTHPVLRIAIDPQLGAEVQGGQGRSLVTQFLELAARRNGVTVQTLRTSSWEASVKAFDEHRVEILPSISDRLLAADVGQRALLSSPFYVGRTVIIARTVGEPKMDLWSLRGRTLAFKGGGAYESWLRREHAEITLLPLADIHQVLAAVESGIADAAIGVDVTYHPIIRRDYALSLRIVGDVTEMPVTVRVAVHRDDPELLAMIEASLNGLTPGERETVIDRWLETAYLRAPTLSQVVSVYRLEVELGLALFAALGFALWQARRAHLASRRGEQQKILLLGVMSHEVRNAVNAVSSSLELLARHPMEGSQRDLMALAQAGSHNLQALLKSALDYAKTESDGFTPYPVACDVQAVAREVIASQLSMIEAKGLEARLDMPGGALPWLLVDEVRLRQVLANLCSNAVKFTERGFVGITLRQEANTDGDGVRWLVIDVYDSGRGIPAGRRDALFTPFTQMRPSEDSRVGGTGLGLVICRDIVRNLGGDLMFSSVEGEGTSVRLRLPTSLVPAPACNTDTLADASSMLLADKGRVLLVEDHPANRKVIAAQLTELGYAVEAVDNGRDAIDAYAAGGFLAALLDVELPDMSGHDVARALRVADAASGRYRTPLVAISANDDEQHRKRCAVSGMDLVLGKPLSLARLRSAMEAVERLALLNEFRAEARRDVAAIRSALARGAASDALRSVHRLHGAALVCGVPAVAMDAMRVQELLSTDGPGSAGVNALLRAIEGQLRGGAGPG